jgi:hypothetical protein
MKDKIYKIVQSVPFQTIYVTDDHVLGDNVIEERFKKIIKRYLVTSIFIENDKLIINYALIGEETFIHSSYADDLSEVFLRQVLSFLI